MKKYKRLQSQDKTEDYIKVKIEGETILNMSLKVFKSFQFFKTVGADTVEPVHLSFVEFGAAAHIVSVGMSEMKQTFGQINNIGRKEAILNFVAALLDVKQFSIVQQFMELLDQKVTSATVGDWQDGFYQCLLLHDLPESKTLLHWAAEEGHLDVAKHLVRMFKILHS